MPFELVETEIPEPERVMVEVETPARVLIIPLLLKVDQSVPVRRPVTPAEDVAIVRVWVPFEVRSENPPVAPAVAKNWVLDVEPFNEVMPAELPQSNPVDCRTPFTSRMQLVPDKEERAS